MDSGEKVAERMSVIRRAVRGFIFGLSSFRSTSDSLLTRQMGLGKYPNNVKLIVHGTGDPYRSKWPYSQTMKGPVKIIFFSAYLPFDSDINRKLLVRGDVDQSALDQHSVLEENKPSLERRYQCKALKTTMTTDRYKIGFQTRWLHCTYNGLC